MSDTEYPDPLGLDCDDCAEDPDYAEDPDAYGSEMDFDGRDGEAVTYQCPQCGRVETVDEPT